MAELGGATKLSFLWLLASWAKVELVIAVLLMEETDSVCSDTSLCL